jgi:V/A-type H+-transporting ATPase subunit D
MKRKVNPNRMMLLRLRRRLQLARRGHKLLKNKQEKLMQNFFALVEETAELRGKVEEDLFEVEMQFLSGRSTTSYQRIEDVLRLSPVEASLKVETKYEMNVRIPVFSCEIQESELWYKLSDSSPAIDLALKKLFQSFSDLLAMVEKENALFRMSEELEKTRRRVNALEYILIPDLEDTIREISDKLSEAERSNQTRLMKIKEMVQ